MINLTYENRSELLFSALAGAVFGVVSGYLVGSRGLGLLIWPLIFAGIRKLAHAVPSSLPPPWTVEELSGAGFVIKDSRGQKIAYVYYEDELAHENDVSP